MNISYITKYKSLDINNWSGTEYFVAKSLEDQGANLDIISGLQDNLTLSVRIKSKLYGRSPDKLYLMQRSPEFAKGYSHQVNKKLNPQTDLIFTTTNSTIAYLNSNKPKVFYADATFPIMRGYYDWYDKISNKSIEESMLIEQIAINNSQLALYSSEWAAQSAIKDFNASPEKVKVVPFGANILTKLSTLEINQLIEEKEISKTCQIIFIGVEWHRKGGDIVLEAVKYLNEELKVPTTLHIVGLDTIPVSYLPNYVINHGKISKNTKEDISKLEKLISESHFLFVPSRAEAYGLVFCEAMAFGVPCISSDTGGIPTIVKNGETGFLLNIDSPYKDYAILISEIYEDKALYKQVSLAAYDDYQYRLNWDAAGRKIMKYLKELV